MATTPTRPGRRARRAGPQRLRWTRTTQPHQQRGDVFDTKADEDGFYGIKTQSGNPLNPGDYEVHSPKKVVSNKVTCKPGNSKIVTVN